MTLPKRGTLIAIVGPSGVGKDSVMDGLSEQLGFRKVRRVITRAAELGGEEFTAVSLGAFEDQKAKGAFALDWEAHGLRYGIPKDIDDELEAGHTLLVNLSRSVLTEAAAQFQPFRVINLSATPETLAARLNARQRESTEEIARRLARAAPLPEGLSIATVSNDGPLQDTLEACLAHLVPEGTAV